MPRFLVSAGISTLAGLPLTATASAAGPQAAEPLAMHRTNVPASPTKTGISRRNRWETIRGEAPLQQGGLTHQRFEH